VLSTSLKPANFVEYLPPDPFHDEHGFPFALYSVRDEATARGGAVERSDSDWELVNADPSAPRITIRFHPDGAASVLAGRWGEEYIPADRAYDPRLNELDRTVQTILDGGYSEFSTVEPGGREIDRGWELNGQVNVSSGVIGFSPPSDAEPRDATTTWTRYPAWPGRS
jgi:hypothetical protein